MIWGRYVPLPVLHLFNVFLIKIFYFVGVLLTFGAMCLGMSLLVMGFLSLGICAFIGVSWLTMLAVQKIFTGVKARIPDGYKSKIPFARKSETEQIKPDINDDEINK